MPKRKDHREHRGRPYPTFTERLAAAGINYATGTTLGPYIVPIGRAIMNHAETQTGHPDSGETNKENTLGHRTNSGIVIRSHGRGKGKGIKRIGPLCTFEYTSVEHSTPASAGIQSAYVIGKDGPAALGFTASVGLYGVADLIQMAKQAWSAIIDPTGGTTTSTTKGQKVFVKEAVTEYHIKNATNMEAEMWIYDMQVRRDIPTVTNTAYADPVTAWNKGATQTYVISNMVEGSQTPSIYPGATPFASRVFCEGFKVLKVSKENFSPGAIHTHRVKQYHSGWIDTAKFNDIDAAGTVSTNLVSLGGISSLTMIVWHGGPAFNTGANNDEIAPITIGVHWTKKYKYFVGDREVPLVFQYSDIPTGTAATTQGIVEATATLATAIAID